MNKLSWQLDYMYGLERFGIRLGLEIMNELMRALDFPHEKFKSVHISGTNGKGSTAILTANSLREAGYKVGMYTSPHLYRFNERIRVNGKPISDLELSALIETVQKVVEERKLSITFFEFTTALALLYFAEQEVDIAVIEVGMGGDLDATNVIHPMVAAITNIGHDHMPVLGQTKKEIARHKAGIYKKGSVAITGEPDPELAAYLEELATHEGAVFCHVKDMIKIEPVSSDLTAQQFRVHGVYEEEFSLSLLGKHQLDNAAVALTILFQLGQKEILVPAAAIKRAFAKTIWEGRLTVVSENPLILVDGAHNEESIHVLHDFLTEEPGEEQSSGMPLHISICGKNVRPRVLVVAMKKDKEPDAMEKYIVPLFEKVIVTEGSFEPKPAGELADLLSKHHPNVQAVPTPAEAVSAAKKDLAPGDLMLVTGSLYMIGDALTALKVPVAARI